MAGGSASEVSETLLHQPKEVFAFRVFDKGSEGRCGPLAPPSAYAKSRIKFGEIIG
jgi:hypothetical protein